MRKEGNVEMTGKATMLAAVLSMSVAAAVAAPSADNYASVTNDWYNGNFSNVLELASSRLAANTNDLVGTYLKLSWDVCFADIPTLYEGIPETADFQAKTDGMFCKYLDEYGEMPGMRDDLMDAVFTVGVGPYKSPDGTTAFFDPLRLTWLKRELKIV